MFEILIAYLIQLHILVVVYAIWVHRGYCHGCFTFSPAMDHACRFIFYTIALGTYPNWLQVNAGTHRMHHKYSDTENDSHSPHLLPLKALLNEQHNPYFKKVSKQDLAKYGADAPYFDDWMQRNVYGRNRYYGSALVVAIYGLMFGWLGLLMAPLLLIMTYKLVMPLFATWIGHRIGLYRHKDHQFPDQSINLFPIGIYFAGEELHSNHHYDSRSPKLSYRWYEFDMGYWYARLFEKLGLLKFRDRTIDPNKF